MLLPTYSYNKAESNSGEQSCASQASWRDPTVCAIHQIIDVARAGL
jgi:hypothetical protein